MDNPPSQQEPPHPPHTSKPNGWQSPPTPAWLWLLLLGGFGLIFYQFVPKAEISVLYYPWFYDQVQADNIKAISIQTLEIRGQLRTARLYQTRRTSRRSRCRFVTNAPSEASIDAVVKKLIELTKKDTRTDECRRAGEN